MGRRKKKKSIISYFVPSVPDLGLDPETKKGIFVILFMILAAVSFLGLIGTGGIVGALINGFLTSVFGWGRWIYPILLFGLLFMSYSERFELRGSNYLGLFIFIISIQALFSLLIDQENWPSAIIEGYGGGHFGNYFADIFIKWVGFVTALLSSFGLLVISLLLLFDTTLVRLLGRESIFAKIIYPINWVFAKIFGSKNDEEENEEGEEDEHDSSADEEEGEGEENEESDEEGEGEEDEEGDEEEGEEEEGGEGEESEEEEEEEERPAPKRRKKMKEEDEEIIDTWWMHPAGVKLDMPLNLLDTVKGKPSSGDIDENKEIIQRTLEQFKIPVDMDDVVVGPTVTQYSFKPHDGVKLSKITNLNNNLALALAAHSIRIEAPIPGKSLVGIEVPNESKAMVGLKEILSSKEYKNRKHNLMVALGKDIAGNAWFGDITKMPHLLVAGTTNSGKSVCLNTLIVSLLYQNSPDELRLIMVDPKRVELPGYNGIPHLLCPVITDTKLTVNALRWCLGEMEQRLEILNKSGKRNIQTYNDEAKIKMPYIVFIIDELADLMLLAAKEIEPSIIRLAQMSRAVGIHLVLATQRPSVDVITGLIKANMPARIAFAVNSGLDSRTILDSLGAEKLLGKGDMLFSIAELPKPIRIQGAFLSDNEIGKIVRFIKQKGGEPKFIHEITEKQKTSGLGGSGMSGNNDDDGDELLAEAREIVINNNKASATLLQRHLRVGYARAARLMDLLEESGVIGPSNGAKSREILITKEQYARMNEDVISGVSLHDRKESRPPESYLDEDAGGPPAFMTEEDEEDESEDEEDEMPVSTKKIGEDTESEDASEETVDDEDDGKYYSK